MRPLIFVPSEERIQQEVQRNRERTMNVRTERIFCFSRSTDREAAMHCRNGNSPMPAKFSISGPRIADTSTHLTSTLTLGTGIGSNNSVSIDDMPYSVDTIERDAIDIANCFLVS